MTDRAKFFSHWRKKLIGAGGLALLGLLCLRLPITQWFTCFSYDLPFALRSGIHPDEAVIVFMDEKSSTELHQTTNNVWDRTLHARLITNLVACHARAIVFDVLFHDEFPEDKSLAAAMTNAIMTFKCPMVLGATYDEDPREPGRPRLTEPELPAERFRVAPWGVANLPRNIDALRQHQSNPRYTSLAWQAANMVGGKPPDPEAERWINYYGPPGAIPHLSYYQVWETNSLPISDISNRIVFVGEGPLLGGKGESSDAKPTPYTRWMGEKSPGVEIQATVCLNLLRHDWLSWLPWPLEFGLVLATPLALAFILPWHRPRLAFGLGLGASLAVAAAGIVLALNFGYWFAWAVVSFVEIPAALVWGAGSALVSKLQEVPDKSSDETQVEKPGYGPPTTEPPFLEPDGLPSIPEHTRLRKIGEGSFGEVWLAKTALGTHRAVKIVLRRKFDRDGPFEREFSGVKAFEPISRSHEGFVPILQFGPQTAVDYFYYVMELADDLHHGTQIEPGTYTAKTLASELEVRKRLPCEECVQLGLSLTSALGRMHEAKLLHRDIKPSNIVFIGGKPKLADIGTVVRVDEAKTFIGSEGYIPPEGPGSPPADIYSLGKVLYVAAMGKDRLKFPEFPTSFFEDPERERLLALNKIIVKACHHDDSRRYQSPREMHKALARLAKQLKTARHETPPK